MVSVLFGVATYLICLSKLDALVGSCFTANTDEKRLQALNARLTSQNGQLREHVVILERAAQIDHIAYKEINKTVEFLQDEIREVKEELMFYRGLVTSSDRGKGFMIQSFALQPSDADHAYHYRIVLIRFQKDDKEVKGTVDLSVIGKQRGELTRLASSDMMVESSKQLRFRFRNFQKIEGYLILPIGFMPHQVVITANLKGNKTRQITKTIDWLNAID